MINRKKKLPKAKAILNDEEVQQNPDMRIDQDFPGFPHPPADKKSISGESITAKIPAASIKKEPKK